MREKSARFHGLRPSSLWLIPALFLAIEGPSYGQGTGDLNGPLASLGQQLLDQGISINSTYVGEFASNPAGGQRHGSTYVDEFSLGADLDLGRLVDLRGGSLGILFTNRDGTDLSGKDINDSLFVQEKFGDGQTYQLTMLTYSQTLFGGLVQTRIGRDDITYNFALQPGACLYYQTFAICDNPGISLLDVNDGSSYWPEATWGGLVQINPTPDLYAKVGVYQDLPALNPRIDHGFDWSGDNGNGVQFGGEIGYSSTQPNALLPDRLVFGTIDDFGHYSANFFSPNQQYGRGLIYLQANKTVYRPDPSSDRGLYLLGGVYTGTAGDSQRADYSWQIGAIYKGLIPSRPADNAAVQVTGIHYTKDLIDALFQERLAEGGSGRPQSEMTMGELNYTMQVTPWLNVTPNLQYIWKPDGMGAVTDPGGLAFPTSNLKNAIVIGTQVVLDIDKALGLKPQ
jgi:porin